MSFVIAFHLAYSLAWGQSLLIQLVYLAILLWGNPLCSQHLSHLSMLGLQEGHHTYPTFTWVVGIQTLGPYTQWHKLYSLNHLSSFLVKHFFFF